MSRIPYRTSVSIDEAVGIMIGWLNGPVEFMSREDNPSEDELLGLEGLIYDLREDLQEALEIMQSASDEEKLDEASPDVLQQSLDKIEKHKRLMKLADDYFCLVDVELGKNEPALSVDASRSNSLVTYVNRSSFTLWAASLKSTSPLTTSDAHLGNAEPLPVTHSETPNRRQRFDALRLELEEILNRMENPTAGKVMTELRKKIGTKDSCVVDNVGNGIKWDATGGIPKILTYKALAERIRTWKNARLSPG